MGFWELLLVLLVVLLFFGAGRLGGLGAGLGKAARGFRDALRPDGRSPDAPPARREPPPASPRELPPGGPGA